MISKTFYVWLAILCLKIFYLSSTKTIFLRSFSTKFKSIQEYVHLFTVRKSILHAFMFSVHSLWNFNKECYIVITKQLILKYLLIFKCPFKANFLRCILGWQYEIRASSMLGPLICLFMSFMVLVNVRSTARRMPYMTSFKIISYLDYGLLN